MTTLRFPPQSIAQAKAVTFADKLWQRPQVEGITIDGPTSRDLDDAIWIESTLTDAIILVHIADVAEFVTLGTLLDKVAIARTATRYILKISFQSIGSRIAWRTCSSAGFTSQRIGG
jgi:ribonuclease R